MAGLTISEVDGVASCVGRVHHALGGAGRVPGRAGSLDRHHTDRWLELEARVEHAAAAVPGSAWPRWW